MALALGYSHPDKLLEELTARQWMDWKLYSEVEPWGYSEQDAQATFTRLTQAQAGGLMDGNENPVEWKDLSLDHMRRKRLGAVKKKERRQSKEEITKAIKRLFGIAGD